MKNGNIFIMSEDTMEFFGTSGLINDLLNWYSNIKNLHNNYYKQNRHPNKDGIY